MKHQYGSVDQICKILKTDPKLGLSVNSAQMRLESWGFNTFHFMDKRRGYMERVSHSIFGGWRYFVWILLTFCVINAIRANLLGSRFNQANNSKYQTLWWSECFMAIIIIGAFWEFTIGECIKNRRTKGSLIVDELENFNTNWDRVRVIRDGSIQQVRIDELVRGDLVEFQKNEIIPADVRIVQGSHNLSIDAFLITGDHENLSKSAVEDFEEIGKVGMLDRSHLAFFPSLVKEGSGHGIVLRTGNDTGLAWLAGHMATSNCLDGVNYTFCSQTKKDQSTNQPISGKDWINAAKEARYITKLIRHASILVAAVILCLITLIEGTHVNANLNGTLFLIGFVVAAAGLYLQVKQYVKGLTDSALL